MGAADGKQNNVAKLGPLGAVVIRHIAQALHQSLAGGDNVADHQGAVGHHGELTVFDGQAGHVPCFVEHPLAGQEADVVDANVLPVAAFLQRIVEGAPENGEDIRGGDLPLLLEVIEHLRGGVEQGGVHLIAHHLRVVHKLSGFRFGDNEIFVEEISAHQPVAIHTLITEFGYNIDLVPIRDHIRSSKKKDLLPNLGGSRSVRMIENEERGSNAQYIATAWNQPLSSFSQLY